jgi:hypothetical protein
MGLNGVLLPFCLMGCERPRVVYLLAPYMCHFAAITLAKNPSRLLFLPFSLVLLLKRMLR